ncbi:cell division protein FtsZ [Helicobacter enhydrae]|uniref:Cell division protein FtsZ n=1 Tax=Helicobacter enhydrae TaxID=222136 RepID=A0A1B1U6R5_9HELI|nr:cell division protein FtsZ [Helicobacter enhydrae]ANV98426.1 cell division protein FtsZ [Helicobacter enhydrae]
MEKQIVVEEIQPSFGAKIAVIGVGGGGSNAVGTLVNSEIGLHQCVKVIVANTDKQHLEGSPAHHKIRLGEEITRGLGAGMRPEIGQAAAEESREEIRKMLEGSDIVFIATGLGGGTGTGASPVIAKIAKELNALTVSVVTKPFRSEGQKKARLAEDGLKLLRVESDSIVVVPNDRLRSVIQERRAGIKESFKIVDDVLVRAVAGITSVMLDYGSNDMNVDFSDVKTVMEHRGLALMGIGEAEGPDAAAEAVKKALSSPLLGDVSIHGAMGILVNFEISQEYPYSEIEDAQMMVAEYAHPDADIKFGTITRDIGDEKVKVTIIATGFEKEVIKGEEDPKIYEEKQTQQVHSSISEAINVDQFKRDEDADLDIPTYLRRAESK